MSSQSLSIALRRSAYDKFPTTHEEGERKRGKEKRGLFVRRGTWEYSPKPFWIWNHIHVHKVYVCEVFAHEVHTYEMYASGEHAREIHATRCTPMRSTLHSHEGTAYVREVQAHEALLCSVAEADCELKFDCGG